MTYGVVTHLKYFVLTVAHKTQDLENEFDVAVVAIVELVVVLLQSQRRQLPQLTVLQVLRARDGTPLKLKA